MDTTSTVQLQVQFSNLIKIQSVANRIELQLRVLVQYSYCTRTVPARAWPPGPEARWPACWPPTVRVQYGTVLSTVAVIIIRQPDSQTPSTSRGRGTSRRVATRYYSKIWKSRKPETSRRVLVRAGGTSQCIRAPVDQGSISSGRRGWTAGTAPRSGPVTRVSTRVDTRWVPAGIRTIGYLPTRCLASSRV